MAPDPGSGCPGTPCSPFLYELGRGSRESFSVARLRRHGAICLLVRPEAASIAISRSCEMGGSSADTLERDRVRPVARSSLLA